MMADSIEAFMPQIYAECQRKPSPLKQRVRAEDMSTLELCNLALKAMTPIQREVFLQHEDGGYSTESIAAYFGLSESRIRGIISEAKKKGRDAINAIR